MINAKYINSITIPGVDSKAFNVTNHYHIIERHSTTSFFSSCLFGLSSANVTILMWRKTGWLFGECKDEKILIGLCLSSRTKGQGVRWKVQTVNHTMPQAFPAIHYRCTILSCPGMMLPFTCNPGLLKSFFGVSPEELDPVFMLLSSSWQVAVDQKGFLSP